MSDNDYLPQAPSPHVIAVAIPAAIDLKNLMADWEYNGNVDIVSTHPVLLSWRVSSTDVSSDLSAPHGGKEAPLRWFCNRVGVLEGHPPHGVLSLVS